MNDQILQAIDAELARLHQARAVLAGVRTAPAATRTTRAAKTTPKPARRELSAKARKAIADAQRKRWAKVKSLKKTTATAPVPKKEPAAG